MHTLSRNQWLTTPQSCQAHSCSLFFSLKVWSMSHSYSSTVRAVTDLMWCRKASRLCLGCGKETHTLAGGKRLVCCFVCMWVCVCVRAFALLNNSCVTKDFACGCNCRGRNKWVGLREWYLERLTSDGEESMLPLFTVTSHQFLCLLESGGERVFLGGVFPLSVSFFTAQRIKKNQLEASEETEAEDLPSYQLPMFLFGRFSRLSVTN